MSGKNPNHHKSELITLFSEHESTVFDWLIMEGAQNDCTRWDSGGVAQLTLDGMDIFLGCATTRNPRHAAEVAVLVEAGGAWNASEVRDWLRPFESAQPHGVWFDVTTTDRTHAWIVLTLSPVEITNRIDEMMSEFLDYAKFVADHIEDTNWSD